MRWASFKSVAFPDQIAEEENERSFIWRLNRWVGLRIAYLLYHMGLSADLVSVIRLLLAITGFYLIAVAINNSRYLAIIGIFLIALQINLDYADGPVARARGKSSRFGDQFDGLANAAVRSVTIIFAGLLTQNSLLFVTGSFTAYVLVTFLTDCRRESSGAELPEWVNKIYRLLLSVFIMAFLLPLIIGVMIVFDLPISAFAQVLVCIYGGLAVVWLIFILRFSSKT